jgi:hypothetical protein
MYFQGQLEIPGRLRGVVLTGEGVKRVQRRGDEDVEGDVGEVDESGEHDGPRRDQ